MIYLCTLCKKSSGELRPVVWDGRTIEEEIVAENGNKARYRWWRRLVEFNDQIKLQDIRVKSLRSRKVPIVEGWEKRLETANSIVRVIAAHGRHFFSENSDRYKPVENPFVSRFLVLNGEVWFVDRYTRKHILVRHQDWPGWSDGGTLRRIVQELAAHISQAKSINPDYFGLSPDWMCDHWGYGEEMVMVRDGVAAILFGFGNSVECGGLHAVSV